MIEANMDIPESKAFKKVFTRNNIEDHQDRCNGVTKPCPKKGYKKKFKGH